MVEVGGRREARRLLLPALGSRFLLHRNFNPGTTTVDDVFVAVTVIDLRSDVPSKVWVNRPNMGLKAFGDDGNLYERNWRVYPDDSAVPDMKWTRCIDGVEFESLTDEQKAYVMANRDWYDVGYMDYICQLMVRPAFIEKYRFMNFCLRHRRLFYIVDGCYRCKLEPVYEEYDKKKLEDARSAMTWRGWF